MKLFCIFFILLIYLYRCVYVWNYQGTSVIYNSIIAEVRYDNIFHRRFLSTSVLFRL